MQLQPELPLPYLAFWLARWCNQNEGIPKGDRVVAWCRKGCQTKDGYFLRPASPQPSIILSTEYGGTRYGVESWFGSRHITSNATLVWVAFFIAFHINWCLYVWWSRSIQLIWNAMKNVGCYVTIAWTHVYHLMVNALPYSACLLTLFVNITT